MKLYIYRACRIVATAFAASALFSCGRELVDVEMGGGESASALDLSLCLDTLESKAIVSGTVLPYGSKVGVFVEDETGNGYYQGHDYRNVSFQVTGNRLMNPSKKIMLTPTTGIAYAYYPYVANATLASLSVNALSQTDHMYSGARGGLSYSNHTASITMRHAMAAITLNIVKGSYSGDCRVTKVSVKGSNLAVSGTYNGKTGAILTRSGLNGTISSIEGAFTLNTTGVSRNIIVIPAASASAATVTLTLDGYQRTATIPSFRPLAGKRYAYTLTVNEEEIVVSDVSVKLWSDAGARYNVYVTGNTTDIAISRDVAQDGTINITAVPMLPIETVNEVDVSGNATVVQTENTYARTRTVSLSSVSSDVYLNFNGLTKNHVVCRYSFPDSYGSDLVFWDEDASMPVLLMTIEGEEGTRVMSSKGLTGREIEVKIWHGELNSDILSYDWFGSSYFKNPRGSYLTRWEIPEGIRYTEGSGLGQVNGNAGSSFGQYLMADLKFPKSMAEIRNHSFMATGVAGLEFHPESEVAVGHRAFYSSKVSSVVFPRKMMFQCDEQFASCPLSGTLTIPHAEFNVPSKAGKSRFAGTDIEELVVSEGVTCIGTSSSNGKNFYGCTSLKSIDLPASLTRLGYYDFAGCSSLKRITCRAMSAPEIITSFGYDTFNGVSSIGELIVPQGATGYEDWLVRGLAGWTIVYSAEL